VTESDEGGQVSEVQSMGDGPEPISDSQAVAGNPESPAEVAESGEADEGAAGPNANTNEGDSTGEPLRD
jgi:hypothetical protein